MSHVVRTRFAPSPTGYLHVGGARTALFNYLLARRLGGRFLLRIEDTDQTRNIAGAEKKLLDDLRWLGLQWDEGPEVGGPAESYYQSRRLGAYTEHARRLLESGRAYYAFDTREELDAMRAEAQKARRNFRYPRPASFPSQAEADEARAQGRPVVVRFAMPEKDYIVADTILGDVRFGADECDDFVIIKGDGWPTYHFAVVVDDEHMEITHVLRGQEHLMNTPKHIALQEAFGYRTPAYAHLPIIMNIDGSKMSKREKDRAVRAALDAAVQSGQVGDEQAMRMAAFEYAEAFKAWRKGKTQLDADSLERLATELRVELPEIDIHDFRRSGYLPEALVNFIALLGWSAGDDREKYTLDELCEAFSVERIGKTNARFDRQKLLSFNTQAAADVPPERLLEAFKDYLSVNPGGPLSGLGNETLTRLLELCRGFRIFRDVEAKCGAMFIADAALRHDEIALRKVLLKGQAAGLETLRQVRPVLEKAAPWTATALEQAVTRFAEPLGLNLGKVAQPLRVAVTGGTVSPAIFDTLELVGRERTLARIDLATERATALEATA